MSEWDSYGDQGGNDGRHAAGKEMRRKPELMADLAGTHVPGAKLSIVVPTYNEVANIEPLIARVADALPDVDWEVLFVDDNSPDGTARAAHELSRRNERVRVILRVTDRGLAKASIQGMLSAKGDLLCVMDGDGQHDPAVIPLLTESLRRGGFDLVSAARRLDSRDPDHPLSPFRMMVSRVGNRLSGVVLGKQLADPLAGFFVIEREAFLRLAPRLRDPGFKLLLDILSSQRSLRHAEVPFNFGHRISGTSKLDAYVGWQFATFLLSKLTGGLLPASLVSFLLVGGTGVLVHLSALYLALGLTAGQFGIAQSFAALTAATSNFLLNNLLTFRDRRLRGWRQFTGYLKFIAISSVGIVANVAVAVVVHESFEQVALVAAIAGIAMDTIWKFVIASRLVWSDR